MYQIITGTIIVSILHALIPSHWIPLLSVSKTSNWTKYETLKVTFLVGLCHVLSSILLGILIGFIGFKLNLEFQAIFKLAGPILLIIMGVYFVYRHHTHHHFQLDNELMEPPIRKKQLILSLMMFMLLSPCIEIEAFFLQQDLMACILCWWWQLFTLYLPLQGCYCGWIFPGEECKN